MRDSASEEVRRARGKVMTIEARIRGVLKNQGGEVTEQVRRYCQRRPLPLSDVFGALILDHE